MNFIKAHKIPLLLALSCAVFYWAFAYDLERHDFSKLLTLYAALTFISYKLIAILKTNFWFLVGLAVIFRLVFLVATPNLSQDFYRFLWDGRMLAEGFNPYLQTPDEVMQWAKIPIAQAKILYDGMGGLSAGHFTNYPPVNQLFFAIAAWLSPSSILGGVVTLRGIILFADLGILYFGKKILEHFKLNEFRIFWFVLNPFVIIEFTGNLHFESVMLFFLVAACYCLLRNKWWIAAVLIGLSVSVKLLPLLLLPALFQYLSSRGNQSGIKSYHPTSLIRASGFYLAVLLTVFLTFLPFLSEDLIANFSATIGLWFKKFEFNASVYYLVRSLGFRFTGYNIIGSAGPVLSVLTFLILIAIAFLRNNKSPQQLFIAALFSVVIYLIFSTTVHPWYVATPLLLCVFTKYRFPVVWSVLVFLSYSAYGEKEFAENLWLVALEYLVVIGFALWEIFIKKEQQQPKLLLFR
ncbi:MAG: glycosyltransferase 87 family protein [Leeuwenhoekiella sp.]